METCLRIEITVLRFHQAIKKVNQLTVREKVSRTVQGISKSQTAANHQHQEGEVNGQTHTRKKNAQEAQSPAPSSPSEVIRMLRQTQKQSPKIAISIFFTISFIYFNSIYITFQISIIMLFKNGDGAILVYERQLVQALIRLFITEN